MKERVFLRLSLLAILAVVMLAFFLPTLPAQARQIRVGDTKSRVMTLLGNPTARMSPPKDQTAAVLFDAVSSETWAYGRRLKFSWAPTFPYFDVGPQFRFFKPCEGDIVIEFDANDRVASVAIP